VATEVVLPRPGELRTRDLRAVYGTELLRMVEVDVLVMDADHGVPVAAHVELADMRAGLRRRRALVCPSCRRCRHLLLARAGVLACGECHRQRTRRQRYRTMADWCRRSGREEDRLLRLLRPTSSPNNVKLDAARELARDIVISDRARLAGLQEELAMLAACVESRR
jgi:hypothetical protein